MEREPTLGSEREPAGWGRSAGEGGDTREEGMCREMRTS